MLLLAASLFFTNPLPLELPKASAYLVREKGIQRLEDRYDRLDLWVSQSVDGRWLDDDGRIFILAHLDRLPPSGDGVTTRVADAKEHAKVDYKKLDEVRRAIDPLSPIEIALEPKPIRRLPRGYKDVDYWQGTNRSAIVCAFLPEKEKVWRLATWELAEGDDYDEALKLFEEEFLRNNRTAWRLARGASKHPSERDLLRRDVHHSVAAYDNWHFTSSEDFVVIDDLPSADFAAVVTNDLTRMRRLYAETLPTPIDATNVLAVARVYATREEYLDALEAVGLTNMSWSAAYWSPQRRELVAHNASMPTLRHEAFHQYLTYATATLPTSPWLNEGYAQYFENVDSLEWNLSSGRPTAEDLEHYSLMLPSVFKMDYDEFYSGDDEERQLKYALARSIAVFIEKGAPEIRFKPFANMKRDYFEELFVSRSPEKATLAAFRNKRELFEKFIGAWLAYWKSH